jgi:hypothetical protein
MHARRSRTVERAEFLQNAMNEATDAEWLRQIFLSPPIHSHRYGEGFGTVYTALYRPTLGLAELCWPGLRPWCHRFDHFDENTRRIRYIDGVPPSDAALQPS